MTKARDLANLISGGFTEADIPNLSASKITSGTFADARIAASNVSQHATSFDDNKIVNDLSTLGLRVHTQENLNVSSTNSTSFDVFNDSSGVASFTTCSRDSENEHVSTEIFGSPSLIDFDDIDGSGTDVRYKSSGNIGNVATNTSFADIGGNHLNVDANYQRLNMSGTGAHWGSLNSVPKDTTDRDTHFMIFDFGAVYQFGGVWYFGKQNGYGDLRKVKLEGSQTDGNYQAIDMSGVTQTAQTKSNGSALSGTESDFTSGSSDGSFILNQHATQYYTIVNTLNNFPTIKMRYLKMYFMNQYTGTANANAGFNFNITKKPVSFSATGNFIGANITTPSTVSKMGAVITYTETGTNTLNTDLIMQLSSDGGSNFTTATLTALPDFATGIKMAKVNDLSLTGGTGTSCTYKISFANQSDGSKVANIKGVSLQY
jgi:hypothetical protein